MIKTGKLCRFDRHGCSFTATGADILLVFDTGPSCGGWRKYPLDTVFVLLGCEKRAWKVLTPDGLVGVVDNGSYDIFEVS